MTTFNRYDICEAYLVLEWDFNIDGWLPDRPSNARRRESTGTQLNRMGFKARPNLSYDTLTENGKAIYDTLVSRYELDFEYDVDGPFILW